MIKVRLIKPNADCEDIIAFGAHTCYQGEEPKLGETINIKARLFDVGHHTTLQHSHFNFYIAVPWRIHAIRIIKNEKNAVCCLGIKNEK